MFFVRILVTGGAGYIGSTVASLLCENGHEAAVFDNLGHSRRERVAHAVDRAEHDVRPVKQPRNGMNVT